MARPWTPEDVPDQTGRRVLVTGAGEGVARATALDLAARGAELVLADRDLDALADVVRRADAAGPHRPTSLHLDLADDDSVRDGAAQVLATTGGRVDLLVLDDGARTRSLRPDGVDAVLAGRVLGPYLLVSRLWDALAAASRGRVVSVVPPTYRLARELSFGEPVEAGPAGHTEPEPGPGSGSGSGEPSHDDDGPGVRERLLRRTALGAPAEAALAGLALALELAERARGRESGFRSLAAVAGLDPTEAVERTERVRRGRGPSILDAALGAIGQRGEVAHHPVLMAATADLPSSTVVGLSGALGLGTTPRIVNPPRAARDPALRRQVWDLARSETGEPPR